MKRPHCQFPPFGLELTTVVRYSAVIDVFRFLLIIGPTLAIFHACTNLNPRLPSPRGGIGRQVDYVLYSGQRLNLSRIEQDMVYRVQKVCGKEYRTNLPAIWRDAQPTLYKALVLEGVAIVLPVVSAVLFLLFQKRDLIASIAAVLHFSFEVASIALGLFGAWFITDSRLCFLGAFSKSYSVTAMTWSGVIISAVVYKALVLYSLDLYIKAHCRSIRTVYHSPSPTEELKTYLHELKMLEITPIVKFDWPRDPNKRDWHYVNATIKKLLVNVRLQMADLHRDDPLVSELLKSGKLHKRKRTSSFRPSVLHIVKQLGRGSGEYKLLKQHQHQHHHRHPGGKGGRDEIEIILPEPYLRRDPDPSEI